jgi:tetratricopeptide (TPR) repeat protein
VPPPEAEDLVEAPNAFVAPPDAVEEPLLGEKEQLSPAEVKELMGEVITDLEAEQLEHASMTISRLHAGGAFRDLELADELKDLIRKFLWRSVLPSPATVRKDRALEPVLEVARAERLSELVSVGERLLVRSLPGPERRERLPELLQRSPRAVPYLQAASRAAVGLADDEALVRALGAAGSTFLQAGELALAARMFMAVRGVEPDSKAATEGLKGVFALAEQTVEASARLKEIRETTPEDISSEDALVPIRTLLARHPGFVPAMEIAARLHELAGNGPDASRIHIDLANRALYREEANRARGHLRRALELDPSREEPLMLLAVLEPPSYDVPRKTWLLKVALLEREHLYLAAMHHARARLTGGADDFRIHATLARLARKAGEDPSPHLMAQGDRAWRMGDLDLAGDCFREALRVAGDPRTLASALLTRPDIDEVIPRGELSRYG